MRKQYQLDPSQDLLKHKLISNHQQHYYPSAKRISKNTNDISQNKSFAYISNNQFHNKSGRVIEQSAQNPQKPKSSSLYQPSKVGSKIEYLTYAQKQFKEQRKVQEQKQKIMDIKQLAELKNKMERYFVELQKKDQTIIRYEKVINDKDRLIQQASEKIKMLQHNCHRYQVDYTSLCQQFKQNQQYYSAIAKNHNALSQKCALLEGILQQKDAFIQKIIFSKDQEYDSAIKCKNNEIQALQQRLNILQAQNSLLMYKINSLQNDPSHQVQPQSNDLSALGQQFQSRINHYVDQNSRLKNTLSHYEGQIEHLQAQKYSLQNTLKAYEQRDNEQKTSSKIQEELNFLRNALEDEKEQKDRAISKYQLQILKLQNQLCSKRLQTHSNLIDMFDEQRLHQSLYIALDEIERLRIKLGEQVRGR